MGKSDEVRRLLDERGIEWWPSDDPCCEDVITHWRVGPFQWTAIEGEKDLWLNAGIAGHEPLTPEQAIAATVGNVGSANTEEVLRQLVARLGDAASFHFASKYVDCIVEEYAGKFATAGMTEEEADSRDLMEAIRDDDGKGND